eukprot:4891162-Pyramimonas_sp.AAC.1
MDCAWDELFSAVPTHVLLDLLLTPCPDTAPDPATTEKTSDPPSPLFGCLPGQDDGMDEDN